MHPAFSVIFLTTLIGVGQGLFVAKTYMAKMGGTIAVENVDDGVRFTLGLPRVRTQ